MTATEQGECGERRTEWPDGGELIVRPMTDADVDGVSELFAGLSPDDRRFRFFAQYRPPREFVEKMAHADMDGRGFQLVAVIERDGQPPETVAEAGYVLLPNGDGELGITVKAGHRGWVGPFVLDALLGVAAARGVVNLEADILVENSRMLALARSRGYATLPVSDFTLLRILIGAAHRTPGWPGKKDRPRLLVEGSGGRWRGADAARSAGVDVIACPGPRPGQNRRCPVLAGQPCPLAEGADAIVALAPRPDDEGRAAVLARLGEVHPSIPLCVEVPHSADVHVTWPPAATVLSGSSPEAELVEVVRLMQRQMCK